MRLVGSLGGCMVMDDELTPKWNLRRSQEPSRQLSPKHTVSRDHLTHLTSSAHQSINVRIQAKHRFYLAALIKTPPTVTESDFVLVESLVFNMLYWVFTMHSKRPFPPHISFIFCFEYPQVTTHTCLQMQQLVILHSFKKGGEKHFSDSANENTTSNRLNKHRS